MQKKRKAPANPFWWTRHFPVQRKNTLGRVCWGKKKTNCQRQNTQEQGVQRKKSFWGMASSPDPESSPTQSHRMVSVTEASYIQTACRCWKECCILYKPKERTWNGYLFWQGIIPSFCTTSTHLILEISTNPFLYFFCKRKVKKTLY